MIRQKLVLKIEVARNKNIFEHLAKLSVHTFMHTTVHTVKTADFDYRFIDKGRFLFI